jgi:hypothetical protein
MNETLENRRQQEITSLAFDTKPKKKKKKSLNHVVDIIIV